MKYTKTLTVIPSFHGECVNLTISQQQLQLFNNYSKRLRRPMVEIRSCNGDFRKIYFLQRAALSEYLALIFFQGTVVFGNSYCKKDHLKALNSCSGNIFLT